MDATKKPAQWRAFGRTGCVLAALATSHPCQANQATTKQPSGGGDGDCGNLQDGG